MVAHAQKVIVHDMDATAYMAMFTDDFSMTSPEGRVHDRAEMEKYLKVNAETTKKVNSYSVVIESITPVENGEYAVIVLQKYDRDQAPLEQPNQPHNIRTSVIQRETWHRDRDAWKIRQIQQSNGVINLENLSGSPDCGLQCLPFAKRVIWQGTDSESGGT